jgi:hypothetical protein
MRLHFGAFRKSQIRSVLVNFLVSNCWCCCWWFGIDTGLLMIGWSFLICNSNTLGRASCMLQCGQKYPSRQRWQRDTPSPLFHWFVVYASPGLCKRHWLHTRPMENFGYMFIPSHTPKSMLRDFFVGDWLHRRQCTGTSHRYSSTLYP